MSYQILPRSETDTDGTTTTLTLHYERGGVQKSCIFQFPAATGPSEHPETVLKTLLDQGKNPSGPIDLGPTGSWRG